MIIMAENNTLIPENFKLPKSCIMFLYKYRYVDERDFDALVSRYKDLHARKRGGRRGRRAKETSRGDRLMRGGLRTPTPQDHRV
jgi:hypothetical protein